MACRKAWKGALPAMSAINVTSVEVLDNPTHFANPLQFEIQYECLYQLQHGAGTPPQSVQPCMRAQQSEHSCEQAHLTEIKYWLHGCPARSSSSVA